MGLFDSLFTNKNAKNAAAAKTAGLQAGQDSAFSQIDQGVNQASGYYDQALVPFNALLEKGNAGYDSYLDATGVNGQDGLDRASQTFTSLPGYQEGINMAVDLNDRRAAARGMLGSGNTIADTTKLATDYASQKYGDYLSALAPMIGGANSAAAGQAGVLTGQGNLFANAGAKKADYGYKSETGIGDANASAELANNAASKNIWDAIMGGASLAAKLVPFPG